MSRHADFGTSIRQTVGDGNWVSAGCWRALKHSAYLLSVVDLPDDGLPTSPINGSRGMICYDISITICIGEMTERPSSSWCLPSALIDSPSPKESLSYSFVKNHLKYDPKSTSPLFHPKISTLISR